MDSKQYKELEKIYLGWKGFCRHAEKASTNGFLYLDERDFSSLISRLQEWQEKNSIPKYKIIEFDYSKMIKYLCGCGTGIRICVSNEQEERELQYINSESKEILKKIESLLDFYSNKIEEMPENCNIQFVDGVIKDINSNTEIHRYSAQTKIYYFCEYIFSQEKNKWINWDKIKEESDGENEDSRFNLKKRFYDFVVSINKYSMKSVGVKIIDNDRKEKYKVMF